MKVKYRNPFRNMVKALVGLHTLKVGEGVITPEKPVTQHITLMNGAEYEVTLRRVKPGSSMTPAFAFPRKPREKKLSKVA